MSTTAIPSVLRASMRSDLDALFQHPALDRDRRRRLGPDRVVEDRQAPWIDRIELAFARFASSRMSLEILVIVDHASLEPVGSALAVRHRALGALRGILGRQLATGTDATGSPVGNRLS